jgi:hypothetical protein
MAAVLAIYRSASISPAICVTTSSSTQSSSYSWVASLTFFMASKGHSHSLPWLSFTLTNRFPRSADTDIRASFACKGKASTDASNKKQGGGWYRPLTQSGQSLFHFDQLYVIAGHLTGVK